MTDRAGRRRARRLAIGTAVVLALAGMNGPWVYRFSTEKYHDYKINRPEYKAENGKWEVVNFPEEYRQNTIHAALLHTGKVLLVAGSGNNADNFDAKKFDTRVWDPVKGTIKKIPTPADLFCTGHTQLANGNLLIAGGTKRYEKLKGDVTKAGGLMVVHNENPDKPITLPAGTKFTGKENGKTFVSKDPVVVERATKVFDKATGAFLRNEPGLGRIYVEAQKKGSKYETGTQDNYRVQGLSGADSRNTYGIAEKIALDKKDFQGIRDAYEFDPVAEKYIKVDPMNEARWYPTLTTMSDGKILSLSGLDEIGQLVPGKNEVYDPKTKKWTYTTHTRQFPTYPAISLMQNGEMFYSGANAGYGPDDVGRDPGVWDVATNKFTKLKGLSDPNMLETAGTVLLPPAQDEKYMVIGGGGVGESKLSSKKTRVIDLLADDPKFTDGPSLEKGTRYPQYSILPDDTVMISGGSEDYRGRGDSNILQARMYDAKTGKLNRVADPLVGRNYHSGSILLPDGRRHVLRLGLPVRGQGRHQAGQVRAAHRDLHAAVPVPRRAALAVGWPADDRTRRVGHLQVRARVHDHIGPSDPPERLDPCHGRRPALHRPGPEEDEGRHHGDGSEEPEPGGVGLVHALRHRRPGHTEQGPVDQGALTVKSSGRPSKEGRPVIPRGAGNCATSHDGRAADTPQTPPPP